MWSMYSSLCTLLVSQYRKLLLYTHIIFTLGFTQGSEEVSCDFVCVCGS